MRIYIYMLINIYIYTILFSRLLVDLGKGLRPRLLLVGQFVHFLLGGLGSCQMACGPFFWFASVSWKETSKPAEDKVDNTYLTSGVQELLILIISAACPFWAQRSIAIHSLPCPKTQRHSLSSDWCVIDAYGWLSMGIESITDLREANNSHLYW